MLRRGLSTLGIQAGQLLSMVGITILLPRVIGVKGWGAYSLSAAVVAFATLLASAGINSAGVYHLGRRHRPLHALVPTLLSAAVASAMGSAVLVIVAYLALRGVVFKEITSSEIAVVVVVAFAVQVLSALAMIQLGLNRPQTFARLNLLQAVATLVFQLVLWLAGGLTPVTALAAWAAAAILGSGVAAATLARDVTLSFGFDRGLGRELLSYGMRGYVANLFGVINYRLDAFIVSAFLGLRSLGYYAIAVAIGQLIWYIANAMGTVVFPEVSATDRGVADHATAQLCRHTLFLTFLGVVAVAVVSRPLVALAFGSGSLPALVPLWLLLPGILTLSCAKVIAGYFSGIGKPQYATYIALVTVVLTVALDVVVIPIFGIGGAAAASSIVYTVDSGAFVFLFLRETGFSFRQALIVTWDDLGEYRSAALATMRRLNPSAER